MQTAHYAQNPTTQVKLPSISTVLERSHVQRPSAYAQGPLGSHLPESQVDVVVTTPVTIHSAVLPFPVKSEKVTIAEAKKAHETRRCSLPLDTSALSTAGFTCRRESVVSQ